MKNGEILHKSENISKKESSSKELLNIKDIYEFAKTVNIDDVREVIQRQIDYNSAIAEEEIKNDWGEAVGKTSLEIGDESIRTKAIAYAAAGSYARMNGCALPVVINSGSGNQGIACTMPVCVYAREMGLDNDKLIRAMVLTDLIAVNQKNI